MRSWGIFLIVIGGGSFILPFFKLQFKILSIFGDYQMLVAILALIVGVILTILSFVRKKKEIVQPDNSSQESNSNDNQ